MKYRRVSVRDEAAGLTKNASEFLAQKFHCGKFLNRVNRYGKERG